MQNENDRLIIHTGRRPVQTAEKEEGSPGEEKTAQETLPPENERRAKRAKRDHGEPGERLTVGERLLRNTAVSCALLLTALAIRNVDQPWSRQATEGIRQAMTMRVDWDETLGKLSFVRALVPDTALVFLNMGEEFDLSVPVNGTVSHEYTEQQPWLEYCCAAGETVCAAMTGTVTAAGRGTGEEWVVLIEDDKGAEAVYGYLADVYVRTGQQVTEGDEIGATGHQPDSRMYFEFRENGEATDPSARMK